ncbi:MAG: RNA polymerase sigma factor [Acidobacteriaceae bacterium]|nr:RNA polymerase sigma factor [Acidobacteriaceae bacterium]MBV9780428.1 RNA polymerase sigma factor [Acidobacteriaceae bacterium]
MESEDEARLLGRAAKGDTEAFRKIFEDHHLAMFRFAYRLAGAVDIAEDVTQECFLQLVRKPGFNQQRGSLRQYLYGIVRNLVRQRQNASDREVNCDDLPIDDQKFTAAGCPDSITSVELNAVVQAAISALPPLQREAIVLCEFEELSLREAAAIVGTDVGTIKSRLHRARERLRCQLAPYRSQLRTPLSRGTIL